MPGERQENTNRLVSGAERGPGSGSGDSLKTPCRTGSGLAEVTVGGITERLEVSVVRFPITCAYPCTVCTHCVYKQNCTKVSYFFMNISEYTFVFILFMP